jgi:hypothetical protein
MQLDYTWISLTIQIYNSSRKNLNQSIIDSRFPVPKIGKKDHAEPQVVRKNRLFAPEARKEQ